MTRTLRRVWNRMLGSLGLRQRDSEIAEEFESHIEMLAEQHLRRGLPRDEAYRQAKLKFGNVTAATERYRDQRGLPWIDTTWQDLRYSVRVLRKHRGFTAVAVLSLAIGIGANTAIFSLVNGVLLEPLPYRNPERLFAARTTALIESSGMFPVNPAQARAWAKECPSIEHVTILRSSRAQVAAGTEPVLLPGARVTREFFTLLGIEPMLGRAFLPEEEQPGGDRVVILTESLWRSRFNADPSWLGRSMEIDGVDHQVVGIVSGTFWRSLAGGQQTSASNGRFELFRPLALSSEENARITGNYNYAALVRVKADATIEQALSEINVVQARVPRPRARRAGCRRS